MNKRFEKWLTIAALGSWIGSVGALVAIEVSSPEISADSALSSEPQATRSYVRRDSQFASILDSQFYQQLKQSDIATSLENNRGHWLSRTAVSYELLNRDFSESSVKSQPVSFASSKETLIYPHKLGSVWMLAQIPESWQQSVSK